MYTFKGSWSLNVKFPGPNCVKTENNPPYFALWHKTEFHYGMLPYTIVLFICMYEIAFLPSSVRHPPRAPQ